ncbi:MAG: DUF4040 domain-containing protein, partial [Elainellaceae cyanobacterium]
WPTAQLESLMIEPYIFAIMALLPLTAGLLVTQVNPYHALVIRGILGAVAALVYALFGAADVALTEALVGTMLSITLYAVAVRSSLNMRIGVVEAPHSDDSSAEAFATELPADGASEPAFHSKIPPMSEPLRSWLQPPLRRHHMRVEFVSYASRQDLEEAIAAKEIHAVYTRSGSQLTDPLADAPVTSANGSTHHLQIRVPRLYQILRTELPPTVVLTLMAASAKETVSKETSAA